MIVAICSGYYSLEPWIGVILAVIVSAIIGALNGIIVIRTRLPSFIVTLAMMLMVDGGMLGIAIALTGSSSISAVPSGSAQMVFASSFNQFHIAFGDIETTFLQSKRTGRWWMQLPDQQFIACSYNDYILASSNEVPERWLRAQERSV